MEDRYDIGGLASHEQIRQQVYNYCRAVDRLDAALGHSVWHEDGTADYGATVYVGSGRGAIDHIIEAHRKVLGHSHMVTNLIIHTDGEKATSEAYHFAVLRLKREGQLHEMRVSGRYLDRWSRRGGSWAIDHRKAVRDFDSITAVQAMSADMEGTRDTSDPSYAILGFGS